MGTGDPKLDPDQDPVRVARINKRPVLAEGLVTLKYKLPTLNPNKWDRVTQRVWDFQQPKECRIQELSPEIQRGSGVRHQ